MQIRKTYIQNEHHYYIWQIDLNYFHFLMKNNIFFIIIDECIIDFDYIDFLERVIFDILCVSLLTKELKIKIYN
jgi:hypothetical protein